MADYFDQREDHYSAGGFRKQQAEISKAEKLARAMENVMSGGRDFNMQLAAQIRNELRRLDRIVEDPK